MRNTLAAAIWAATIGISALLGACGDDDGGSSGGAGGEAAGGEPNAGSGGKAGAANVDAGASGMAQAGAMPSDGGAGPSGGGAPSLGGANDGGGGANEAGSAPDPVGGSGAGGEGGASSTPVEYACTATSINHELCSAYSAAACPEEFDCATCVTDRKGEREQYSSCATCLAELDKFFQCGIDAFESGNLASGVECVPDYGPDMTSDCYLLFDSAMNCNEWANTQSCPEKWPLD